MYLAFVVAVEEIANGFLAGRFSHLILEEVEVVVCVSIDNGDADVVVSVVGVGGLVDFGGAGGNDVGRVEFGVHGVGLTGVDHEEHFMVSVVVSLDMSQKGEIMPTSSSPTSAQRHLPDRKR